MSGDTELNQVVREITRAINYLPRLSHRLAWRLHTDDWMKVRAQMGDWVKEAPAYRPALPMQQLFICGVQVFADDCAPRLSESA